MRAWNKDIVVGVYHRKCIARNEGGVKKGFQVSHSENFVVNKSRKWGTTDWGNREEQKVSSNLRQTDFEITPENLRGNI